MRPLGAWASSREKPTGGRPPTGSRTSCSPAAGPEAYDDWTFHRLPFDSPPIRRAFEQFGEVVFSEGSVLGGPEGAAATFFEDAQRPMIEDASADAGSTCSRRSRLRSSTTRTTWARRPTRSRSRRWTDRTRGLIGGGEMIGAFSDRPEVRELVRFFLSPEHGVEAAKQGLEYMSPNLDFDVRPLPPVHASPGRGPPGGARRRHVPIRRVRPHAAADRETGCSGTR